MQHLNTISSKIKKLLQSSFFIILILKKYLANCYLSFNMLLKWERKEIHVCIFPVLCIKIVKQHDINIKEKRN